MNFVKTSIAGAVIALAGCEAGTLNGLTGALPGGVSPAITSVSMFSGAVTAVGPIGYCVDPDSSRLRRGFAIFAPCSVLGVAEAPAVISAIATIQVGAADSAIVGRDPAAFAGYLKGENGPVVLSRSGDADTVSVTAVRTFDRHVVVHLRDKAPAHIEGAQEDEWRAFLDGAGRLLTISVRGLDEAPLNGARGAALLDQAVRAMIAANSPADA